ncbi:MAG TPA: F0F1 ATP synthase subunit B [Caldilineae bacterium]|nr:F0F1 ATP synthase subunit B [Caldilineae bacterium]
MDALGINGPFLLAQIVNFVILYLLLSRLVFPPLLKMLDERKQKIAEGLTAAEVARQEAEAERAQLMNQLEQERAEAQRRIAAASTQAEKVKAEILASAQKEAEEIKVKAKLEAEAEKQRILADAEKQIAELTMLATERVVRLGMDQSLQHKLIEDFLSETSLN